MLHSGIVLNQWEALSDHIVVACSTQSMRMAMATVIAITFAIAMTMAKAIALAMATAIAIGTGVYCAAKSLVFMQFVGNLHGG